MLLPSAAGSASAVSVFPESMASGEEPGEDTSPVTDHAGVRQQPEVLLCEGSHHITPLDVLLCEGSHHITPLPLTTVSKECISGIVKVPRYVMCTAIT